MKREKELKVKERKLLEKKDQIIKKNELKRKACLPRIERKRKPEKWQTSATVQGGRRNNNSSPPQYRAV